MYSGVRFVTEGSDVVWDSKAGLWRDWLREEVLLKDGLEVNFEEVAVDGLEV